MSTMILAYKNVAHVQMCGKTGKVGGAPYGKRENKGKEADPQNNRKGVGKFFCTIFADFKRRTGISRSRICFKL